MRIQTKLFKVLLPATLLIAGLPALAMHQDKFELNQALWVAASNGNEPEVKRLIKSEANINVDNFMDVTALMIAAENGHVAVVQTLLKHGANANAQAKSFYNRFALRQATRNGHLEVVKALLTTISDADAQTMRDSYYALLGSMGQRRMKIAKDVRQLVTNHFIDALVQNYMERVVQPMVNLQDGDQNTARAVALKRHYQTIADLLDLNNPLSQATIRNLIKANIWHAIRLRLSGPSGSASYAGHVKAQPKSKYPPTHGFSWDEAFGTFEPMDGEEDQ